MQSAYMVVEIGSPNSRSGALPLSQCQLSVSPQGDTFRRRAAFGALRQPLRGVALHSVVGVGVGVSVNVNVGATVRVTVSTGVGLGVCVGAGVAVRVLVADVVGVGTGVSVSEAVAVGD